MDVKIPALVHHLPRENFVVIISNSKSNNSNMLLKLEREKVYHSMLVLANTALVNKVMTCQDYNIAFSNLTHS